MGAWAHGRMGTAASAVACRAQCVTPRAAATRASIPQPLLSPGLHSHAAVSRAPPPAPARAQMYVGVELGGAGKDVIIAVDLVAGKPDATTTLSVPVFRALWGTCDGSGVVGGISFVPGASPADNGTATFGTVTTSGAYTAGPSIGVPPAMEPSGLFTATSPATFKDDYLAAFYRPGSDAGSLWAVDPFGGGGDDELTDISYRLIGAAWDRE